VPNRSSHSSPSSITVATLGSTRSRTRSADVCTHPDTVAPWSVGERVGHERGGAQRRLGCRKVGAQRLDVVDAVEGVDRPAVRPARVCDEVPVPAQGDEPVWLCVGRGVKCAVSWRRCRMRMASSARQAGAALTSTSRLAGRPRSTGASVINSRTGQRIVSARNSMAAALSPARGVSVRVLSSGAGTGRLDRPTWSGRTWSVLRGRWPCEWPPTRPRSVAARRVRPGRRACGG